MNKKSKFQTMNITTSKSTILPRKEIMTIHRKYKRNPRSTMFAFVLKRYSIKMIAT